ncbi:MAG: 2-amino-4-hydroxy-6-hydroxymethyldihydropteridine diphosphokinase [Cyclobacteriaceae bacterium]
MNGVFLLLGTNMGNKTENLQKALNLLQTGEVHIVDYSSVYQTAPWGKEDQNWFLNMVVRVDSTLNPEELLHHCQGVEQKLGRKRIEKWGSRIIDVDILYYDNIEMNLEDLIIPHPGIAMRKFTLIALDELVPDERHPILNLTQKEMLNVCPDELECSITDIQIQI